jgi:hypothetical protein
VILLSLDCFLPSNEILVEAVGWSDLLLGVVVGALKPPDPMLMERRISTVSFQPPNFANKKYLEDAARIGDDIIEVMQPKPGTCFKVCSEYVLSGLRKHLVSRGFNVQKVDSSAHLKNLVDKEYIRWCVEAGVPADILVGKRRFWSQLEWVAQRPNLREGLVKTGWASWQRKWRQEIYNKPLKLR